MTPFKVSAVLQNAARPAPDVQFSTHLPLLAGSAARCMDQRAARWSSKHCSSILKSPPGTSRGLRPPCVS